MKRSPLLRRTPLKRSAPPAHPRARKALERRTELRSKPKRRPVEPGEAAWKRGLAGWCDSCGHFSWRLHHHHVYPEVKVRWEGGWAWDPRNGMYVCALCHMNHHAASHRIPLEKVPAVALAFTVDLIGEDKAVLFFARRYEADVTRRIK